MSATTSSGSNVLGDGEGDAGGGGEGNGEGDGDGEGEGEGAGETVPEVGDCPDCETNGVEDVQATSIEQTKPIVACRPGVRDFVRGGEAWSRAPGADDP